MTKYFSQGTVDFEIFAHGRVQTGIRKDIKSFKIGGVWHPLVGVTFAHVLEHTGGPAIAAACGVGWYTHERLALMDKFRGEGVIVVRDIVVESYDGGGERFTTKVPKGTRLIFKAGGDARSSSEAWMIRPDRVYGLGK
jgi:hypothetical protein